MDLQLGLALPTNSINGSEPEEMVRSEPWTHDCNFQTKCTNKRGFNKALVGNTERMTQLMLWNDQPNDGDDRRSPDYIDQYDEEGDGLIGWPPIRPSMKKVNHHHLGGCDDKDPTEENGYDSSNSMYVKVNMEGVAIGRKANLSLYQSYETLTTSLIAMFGKYHRNANEPIDVNRYTLTYQDREGDWLLVGDVPWQTFVQSIQRLKITIKE